MFKLQSRGIRARTHAFRVPGRGRGPDAHFKVNLLCASQAHVGMSLCASVHAFSLFDSTAVVAITLFDVSEIGSMEAVKATWPQRQCVD